MEPIENIEEIIRKKLDATPGPALHDRVLARVRQAWTQNEETTPALSEPVLGRTIMRSPITKLAIAAAIIAAVVLGLFEFIGTDAGSGVVWAQVLEKTEQIPAVVYDMTREIDEPQGKLVLPSKHYVAGDYGTRSDTFMDGKLMAISYRLHRKNVVYKIKVDRKQYWRLDVSYDQAALGSDPDDPRTWLRNILSGGGYTELGRTTIDGVVVEGIEGHQLEDSGEDCVMRIWVAVETNLPVRIEMEVKKMEGGRMRQSKFVMENFDWNAQLDESFFEPNIPDDYTQVENPRAARARQENPEAPPTTAQVLTEQEQAALPDIRQTVTLFLQACSDRNWDEILKHAPGMAKLTAEQREAIDTHCNGLEIVQVGEPFKAGGSNTWRVPCQITWKTQATGNKEIRVRYDETLGRFKVSGGL